MTWIDGHWQSVSSCHAEPGDVFQNQFRPVSSVHFHIVLFRAKARASNFYEPTNQQSSPAATISCNVIVWISIQQQQ